MRGRLITVSVMMALVGAACGGAEEVAPSTTALVLPSTNATEATTATVSVPSTIAQLTETPRASGTFGNTVLGNREQVALASARFEAIITMVPGVGSEIPDDITITLSGAFDGVTGDSEMTMDWGSIVELAMADTGGEELPEEFAEMFQDPLQMKTVDGTSYIKWGFFGALLGTDKWISGPADESADLTSGFGFGADGDSPTALLDTLADADADVEDLGPEEVRGVTTTHYRAVLDIERLAEDLSPADLEELQADIGELTISDFPIDVWVGDDGNVYRYMIEVDATAVGGTTEDFELMTVVFEMWDYGASIDIEPPPADEVATEDELGFFGFDG